MVSFVRVNLNIALVAVFAILGTVWFYYPPAFLENITLQASDVSFLIFESKLLSTIALLFLLLIFGNSTRKNKPRTTLMLLSGVLVFVSLVSVSPPIYSGFYEHEPGADGRWAEDRAEIIFYSQSERLIPYLQIGLYEGLRNASLEITVNGKVVGLLDNITWQDEIYLLDAPLRAGKNKIILQSSENCLIPFKEGTEGDSRCLNFFVGNFVLLKPLDLPPIIFTQGWYPKEQAEKTHWRWMSNNAVLILNSPREKTVRLTGTLASFKGIARELTIHQLNKDSKEIYQAEVKDDISLDIELELSKGENKLKFVVEPDCQTSKLDSRCLSIALKDWQIDDFYDE